jgi:hypothetical protein
VRNKSKLRLSGALIVLVSCVRAFCQDAAEELYTGIRADLLFRGWRQSEPEVVYLTERGVVYHDVVYDDGKLFIWAPRIAVYPDVESAKAGIRNFRSSIPAPEDSIPSNDAQIADDFLVWTGPHDNGSMAIRIKNVTLFLNYTGPRDTKLEFVRQLVERIETDRDLAPRGTFQVKPAIKRLTPSRVRAGETAMLTADLAGVRDSDHVRIDVRGLGTHINDSYVAKPGEWKMPGRPLEAPRAKIDVPAEVSGKQRVTVLIATAENVLIRKEVEVNVVRR